MVRIIGPFASEMSAQAAASAALVSMPRQALGQELRFSYHVFKIRVFKPSIDKDGKVTLNQGFDWYAIIYATGCCNQ